jgi:nicotinamidase-related amidase
VLPGVQALDRTSINAWEDADFKKAVEATGRRKLIMAALWTEVCLAFPGLDAMRDGYETYPIVDAVGGTSVEAHQAGLERLYLAGAKPASVASIACELQRDWSRIETVPAFKEILIAIEGGKCQRELLRCRPRALQPAGEWPEPTSFRHDTSRCAHARSPSRDRGSGRC